MLVFTPPNIPSLYTRAKDAFGLGPTNEILYDISSAWTTPTGLAVIANTPQLAISIGYLAYNGLLTRMHSEIEWSWFGETFKTLRVSGPREGQRSSYRLQIPYVWSIPILAVSTLLHWLMGNSLYSGVYQSELPSLPRSSFRLVSLAWNSQLTLVFNQQT